MSGKKKPAAEAPRKLTGRALVAELFRPIPLPPDPKGTPQLAHMFQVPSDRLRERAAEFVRIAIGLVPDDAYHEVLAAEVHRLVIEGERALCVVLESRDDIARRGYRFAYKNRVDVPEQGK